MQCQQKLQNIYKMKSVSNKSCRKKNESVYSGHCSTHLSVFEIIK